MNRPNRGTRRRFRLPAAVVAAGAVITVASMLLTPVPARAQSDVSDRMDRLERDMRQLQQDYYSGSGQRPGQAQSGAQGGAPSSDVDERLNAVEQSLRDLRGQVEDQGFKQRQILQRLDLIEQKLGVAPPAPAASPPPGQSGDAAPPGAPQTLGSASPPPGHPGMLGTLPVPPDQQAASAEPEAPAPAPKDEKGQFDAAIATLYQGNRTGGIKGLEGFIKQHPKSKQVPQAYYWLGEAQLADKAYRESAEAFLTVVTKYPKDPMAPKSLVKLGSALIAGGQAKEGCKQLKSVKQIFPKADQTIVEMANRERKLGNCAA